MNGDSGSVSASGQSVWPVPSASLYRQTASSSTSASHTAMASRAVCISLASRSRSHSAASIFPATASTSCRPGPRISLASVETRRPNRSAEALAHHPLPVMSQPTLWGHASRGPRQGLAGGCAPSDPPNGNGTSWNAGRDVWVKIRASVAERAEWHAKARSAGLTLSDLVRLRRR